MAIDYSAPQFQGPRIRAGVWKAVHAKLKKKGVWRSQQKNDKGQLLVSSAIKESCGYDDWWMDYYYALWAKVGYDPDHFASYEQRTKNDVLELIRSM